MGRSDLMGCADLMRCADLLRCAAPMFCGDERCIGDLRVWERTGRRGPWLPPRRGDEAAYSPNIGAEVFANLAVSSEEALGLGRQTCSILDATQEFRAAVGAPDADSDCVGIRLVLGGLGER